MKEGKSKKRKHYNKPSYQAEEILEKMSLACVLGAPDKTCKTPAQGFCAARPQNT